MYATHFVLKKVVEGVPTRKRAANTQQFDGPTAKPSQNESKTAVITVVNSLGGNMTDTLNRRNFLRGSAVAGA
ncbi:MAG: twin-arginine translocation signal domain-containing protein, partial [Silicimonas sp.]|nr:twin-arginine translocation signal domain-containing protein [Silicimonas sp.]